jgi:glycosyltransferase involved in cell wall biosynthesis
LEGCLPSGDPVFQWLDGLDIYIQPSFTEGLPRALVEAMSRGLPALGSTCGGIPELLPPECLHMPGDDKTLAAHLARMIQDKACRIQQARRNFSEAQNYYADRVEAKRDAFWHEFAEYVKRRGP